LYRHGLARGNPEFSKLTQFGASSGFDNNSNKSFVENGGTNQMSAQEPSAGQAGAAAAHSGLAGEKKTALAMFGLLLLIYVLMVADRFLISMLAVDIRAALDLTVSNSITLATMFTLGLGISGIPAAYLIQHYSRKTVVQIGLILLSVSTLLFTQAVGFKSMFVFIVMQGVGMGFLATSLFSLSTSYFHKNRAAALGIVNLSFGLGSILGHWVIGVLRDYYGAWEAPMYIFGGIGIALVIAVVIFVRPWFSEVQAPKKTVQDSGGADSWKNFNTILLIVMSGLYGMVIYGYLGSYPSFLRTVAEFTPTEVGNAVLWFGIGGLTSYYGGKLGDKFTTKSVLFVCSLILAGVTLFLYNENNSVFVYKLLATLVGVFGAAIIYTNLAGGHVKALKRSMTGKGSGLFVTSVYGGAAIAGLTMGTLIENYGWAFAGQVQISGLCVVIAILALFIREKDFSR
jgi:predicted MFS family arabinose efflux permease